MSAGCGGEAGEIGEAEFAGDELGEEGVAEGGAEGGEVRQAFNGVVAVYDSDGLGWTRTD